MDTRAFLEKLIAIKNKLNERIPLASNRYEEFEVCGLEDDQDEVDRKFFIHEKLRCQEFHKFYVYEEINAAYREYLIEHNIKSIARDDKVHVEKLKDCLLSLTVKICSGYEKVCASLEKKSNIDFDAVKNYLHTNIESILTTLCSGRILEIENQDFSRRFKLDLQLSQERKLRFRNTFNMNAKSMIEMALDEQHREKLKKTEFLFAALYIDQIGTTVGYCGEHVSLSVKMILEEIQDKEFTLEEVVISYEEGDNHVFLAIDRDPQSNVNDISSWGPNAILFDAWNRIVCMASDFKSLPVYYFSYPDAAKWEITIKLGPYDHYLLKSLRVNEDNFSITGHNNQEERDAAILEEYNLVDLNEPTLKETKNFIEQLYTAANTEKDLKIKLFLTCSGSIPIQIVYGLTIPAIAVHKDYLTYLVVNEAAGDNKTDEAIFIMAWCILFIKHFPLSSNSELSELQSSELDIAIIKEFTNGTSAINFLRNCIEFINKHNDHDDVQRVSVLRQYHSVEKLSTDIYNKRLKNVITYLASDESSRHSGDTIPVNISISNEMHSIKKFNFFDMEFSRLNNNLEKFAFLTSKLPELRKELLPFEMTNQPCIRLREFCHLLNSINNDWDEAQGAAAGNLIDQAFEQRIPGFDYIYRNALGLKPEKSNRNYAGRFNSALEPHGIFKGMQIAINNFIAANNKEDALNYANLIMQYDEKVKNHMQECYYVTSNANEYAINYKKEHNDNVPRGLDRYYGSSVGRYINWRGFNDSTPTPHNDTPWGKYFAWIDSADNDLLPKVLWRLGVIRDRRLLNAFKTETLLQLIDSKRENKLEPLIKLDGRYKLYGCDNQGMTLAVEMIIDHIAENHVPDYSMLQRSDISNDEKFKLFYDANKFSLMAPTERRNSNNYTVRRMLQYFEHILNEGSEADKKIVKDFFISREDNRDFTNLLRATRNYCHVKNLPLYANFFLEQRIGGREIELYSVEEALKAYKQHWYEYDCVQPYIYMRMFGLKEREFTISVLLTLIPLLIKEHLNHVVTELIVLYLKNNPRTLLNAEFLSLVEYFMKLYDRKSALEMVKWDLPDSWLGMSHIDISKLIVLYRSYDEMILFPSLQLHRKFGRLIMDAIKHIETHDNQIKILDSLLLLGDEYHLPISDLNIRNEAIDLWCKAVLVSYGTDDGSQAYFDKIKPVVDKIIDKSSNRDLQLLLVKLTESICSQHMLSEYIGLKIDPAKYIKATSNKSIFSKGSDPAAVSLGVLANVAELIGNNSSDQQVLLNYLSESLTAKSSLDFANFLSTHPKLEEIGRKLNFDGDALKNINYIEMLACVIYHLFWDRPLEQRSLAVNYLLIPPDKITTKSLCDATFSQAFEFVVVKLFPQANVPGTDDHLAKAFLKAYLDSSDEYSRGFLLSGMLVANNEGQHNDLTLGKKLVLLCEHMGPAYIKLAQAIHSYPGTPAHIRDDLKHIKGRANPPTRWQLCRMIDEVLAPEDRKNIKRIGRLLGSASYNLALEVDLQDGSQVVLILLRENAAKQAENGFAHLKRAVQTCDHPRVRALNDTAVSLINQARDLSLIEMDQKKSAIQFEIAADIYQFNVKIGSHIVKIHPSKLFKSGKGYRFIEEIHGEEFNTIVMNNKSDPIINIVAEAIVTLELQNILRGGCFDCDRHGNQLRIRLDKANNVVDIGLYDFGEMSLERPSDIEIMQFVNVLNSIDYASLSSTPFATLFENELSKHIETLHKRNDAAKYLMHIRKGVLSLQDFYQHVPTNRLIKILLTVAKTSEIHPILTSAIANWTSSLEYAHKLNNTTNKLYGYMGRLFGYAAEQNTADLALEICHANAIQDKSRLR